MDGNLRQETERPASSARARSQRDEMTVRLDTVEGWLAQRKPRGEIIELAGARWGVSTRQTDRYIAQAAARWREQCEPERETSRRHNLATVDIGIAEAFRQHKLRDVAALVRLRAMLDGSLSAQPLPLPSPSPPEPETEPLSLASLMRSTADLLLFQSDLGELSPELEHEIKNLLSTIETVIRAGQQLRVRQ